MYENELSNGVSEGLTLETYGKDLPLTRGAIVTFLHRLNKAGVTTFVGESSNAGDALLGIDGVDPSDVDVDFSDLQDQEEIVDTGVEDAVTVLTETPRDEVVTQVTEDIQEVYGIIYDNSAVKNNDMGLAIEMKETHVQFEALVKPTIKFDPDTRILIMDVPHLPDNLRWDRLIELATADVQQVQEYAIPKYHPAPYDKFIRTKIDINEFQGQKIELDLKQDETLDWDSKDKVRVYMNCQTTGGSDTGGSAYYEYWLE